MKEFIAPPQPVIAPPLTEGAPVRVAVVGVGNFGTLHAETLAKMRNANLLALVDSDVARARHTGDRLGVEHVYSDLEGLLADEIVEAVIIATRADSHLDLATKAAETGLTVLVEKPLANSSSAIAEFTRRLGAQTDRIMVDHVALFHSLTAPLIQRVRERGFRALHFVRHRPASIGQKFPRDHPIQLNMVHDLYLAAGFVGGEDPVSFHAMDSADSDGRVSFSWATLRWTDGRTATFHCHFCLPEGAPTDGWDRIEVYGDGFHSQVTTSPGPWVWTEEKAKWPVFSEMSQVDGRPTGMLVAALEAFLAVGRGSRVPTGCRVEDAQQLQGWIETLIQLAEQSHVH